MNKIKKISAIGLIGVVGLMGLTGCQPQSNVPTADEIADAVIEKTPKQTNTIELDTQAVANAIVNDLPEQVEVQTEKVVDLSKEDLDLVLETIYDNNGDVSYLTDDLNDDELDKIVDRIVFSNDIKEYAVQAVYQDGIDELNKENVLLNNVTNESIELDEDDIERFKVYDDAEEIKLSDVSYDDKDAFVFVDAKFQQDDIWFEATFRVKIRDGAVDDISLREVSKR